VSPERAVLAPALILAGLLVVIVASMADSGDLPAIWRALDRWPAATAINAGLAVAGLLTRSLAASGSAAGFLLGATVAIAAGWRAWVVFTASIVLALAATRAGSAVKARLGIAEPGEGRRDAAHAVANAGAAAAAAIACVLIEPPTAALVACVAAIATSMSDTVASEIGKAWGRRTWLLTEWRPVPAGTIGGVSAAGTLAGMLSACAIAGLSAALALIPPGDVAGIVVAASIASLLEGVLGATFESRGLVTNHLVNLLNSLAGAVLALLWHLVVAG
jgi:uncharacterized protein (TIGR00297 family)